MSTRAGACAMVVGMLCASSAAEIKPVAVGMLGDPSSPDPIPLTVPLDAGEVLVVTSWAAVSIGGGLSFRLESPNGIADSFIECGSSHSRFFPGVVFEGDATTGAAALFVSAAIHNNPRNTHINSAAIQGYIATKSDWMNLCAQPPLRSGIAPVHVSVTNISADSPTPLEVALDEGQVLVATSWSTAFFRQPGANWVRLESSHGVVDCNLECGPTQHRFFPGIVFSRDEKTGMADVFVTTGLEASRISTTVSLQGYIADEGEWFGTCSQPAAADVVSPTGMLILAGLIGTAALIVIRRRHPHPMAA